MSSTWRASKESSRVKAALSIQSCNRPSEHERLEAKPLESSFLLTIDDSVAPHIYVNIILDSTVANSAFLYGLAQKLWSKDMFLLWSGVQDGAKADELSEAWTKAPKCEIGLTVWNCNDGDDIGPATVQQ